MRVRIPISITLQLDGREDYCFEPISCFLGFFQNCIQNRNRACIPHYWCSGYSLFPPGSLFSCSIVFSTSSCEKQRAPTATPFVTQRHAINYSLFLPFIFLWWAVFWFNAYDVPTLGAFPLHSFVNHFATTLGALLRFTQLSTSLFCGQTYERSREGTEGGCPSLLIKAFFRPVSFLSASSIRGSFFFSL